MSAAIGKRKRARKACIPCHQRKRKCDSKYPCNMCAVYEYRCSYADINKDDTGGTSTMTATDHPPPVKRVNVGLADNGASSSIGIDEHKFRYAGSSAAMAFPHILAGNSSNNASNMHSVAFNFGMRPDETSNAHGSLGEIISEDDLARYSSVYFSAMGSIGDLIDPRIYAQRCRDYFHDLSSNSSTSFAFGALAAGLAALGSFLSPTRHSRESDLVKYAKGILDDPASMRMLQVDHIIAWGMRVFYLRATTRPNNAWIASCTTMHLCEAVGLHEEDNIKKMASVAGAAALGHDADRLRRIFWIGWAGHTLLSYEYDRSSVHFRTVTTQAIVPVSGSIADQFVQIAQIIPSPNSPFHLASQPRTQTEELFERLKALHELQFIDPFLLVTKADLAFCFYRRAYQLKMGMSDEFIQLVISIGNASVDAAKQLAHQGRFFWNVIGSVFHYACVLLAIDTPIASMHMTAVFKGLENLVMAADTGHTREALFMAQHLLSLHLTKKRKELAQLEPVQASYQSFQAQPECEATTDIPEFGYEVDWDQFLLEPYISMFSGDVQL